VFQPIQLDGLNVTDGERVELSMSRRSQQTVAVATDLLPHPPIEDQSIVAPYDLFDLDHSKAKRVPVRRVTDLLPDGIGLD
jgi:hypothetical protein